MLTKDEYIAYKNDYLKDEERIKGQIELLQQEDDYSSETNQWLERLNKYKKIDKLTRELVVELIDRIIISHHKNSDGNDIDVKIIFKFKFL